ncbi:alpha/beta hydrolase [Afifella sp. H1R]|uniref:alpha/beta hydrolase n=1 Tax=unclassified Afifella TaxID=2624128 RepID=UPI001F3A3534|nr:alpha/beta hydrolase [Afifella sp. H1R]MCF1505251.1 alpha/beta hydrolase [Afifella sp. H1R]
MPTVREAAIARDHEWQYNPRVSTDDVEAYHARADTLSEEARLSQPDYLADISYGEGHDETVDIFPAAPDSPLHLFLHGGYWRGRDKRDYSFLAQPFVRSGISLVIANYSLCPKVELPEIVEQTKRCLAALPSFAAKIGADKTRITASGHSAGAHLLACALATADGPPPGGLAAAALISGIYELQPVLGITVNESIRLRPEQVAAVSPLRMRPRTDVALDIIVGSAESPGWVAQSALFAEHCQKAGASVDFHVEPGANHFSIMERYANERDPLFERLRKLALA